MKINICYTVTLEPSQWTVLVEYAKICGFSGTDEEVVKMILRQEGEEAIWRSQDEGHSA